MIRSAPLPLVLYPSPPLLTSICKRGANKGEVLLFHLSFESTSSFLYSLFFVHSSLVETLSPRTLTSKFCRSLGDPVSGEGCAAPNRCFIQIPKPLPLLLESFLRFPHSCSSRPFLLLSLSEGARKMKGWRWFKMAAMWRGC